MTTNIKETTVTTPAATRPATGMPPDRVRQPIRDTSLRTVLMAMLVVNVLALGLPLGLAFLINLLGGH